MSDNKSQLFGQESQRESADKKKELFMPPEIKFIPLKVEERLMACQKQDNNCSELVQNMS